MYYRYIIPSGGTGALLDGGIIGQGHFQVGGILMKPNPFISLHSHTWDKFHKVWLLWCNSLLAKKGFLYNF